MSSLTELEKILPANGDMRVAWEKIGHPAKGSMYLTTGINLLGASRVSSGNINVFRACFAATVMFSKTVVTLADSGIRTICDGSRKGLQVLEEDVRSDETTVNRAVSYDLNKDSQDWRAWRLADTVYSAVKKDPYDKLRMPVIYRLVKKPEVFEPLLRPEILTQATIRYPHTDGVTAVRKYLQQNLTIRTAPGELDIRALYLIPYQYLAGIGPMSICEEALQCGTMWLTKRQISDSDRALYIKLGVHKNEVFET